MLRLANIDDVEQIYNLNTELFIVLNNLKENIYNPVGFPKTFIISMINSSKADYIVIEDDDKIVGYALIEEREAPFKEYTSFKKDKFAFIYELIVLPEYRSKGYGTRIIDEAVNWAKKRELTSIELNALSNNYSARAFYENVGFQEYQVKLRKEV